jgi:nicotinamidase-related amidase
VGAKAAALLKNTASLIEAARQNNVPVIYVQVAFRPGYPEVSPRNKTFAGLSKAGLVVLGNPGTDIHAAVAPRNGEVVVVKHRVGALSETEMQTALRAKGVENLIMAGISTSGVILSTLRLAADYDYGITVVSDACADTDEEVHRVLMEKVFPRQAEVIPTSAALALLSAK